MAKAAGWGTPALNTRKAGNSSQSNDQPPNNKTAGGAAEDANASPSQKRTQATAAGLNELADKCAQVGDDATTDHKVAILERYRRYWQQNAIEPFYTRSTVEAFVHTRKSMHNGAQVSLAARLEALLAEVLATKERRIRSHFEAVYEVTWDKTLSTSTSSRTGARGIGEDWTKLKIWAIFGRQGCFSYRFLKAVRGMADAAEGMLPWEAVMALLLDLRHVRRAGLPVGGRVEKKKGRAGFGRGVRCKDDWSTCEVQWLTEWLQDENVGDVRVEWRLFLQAVRTHGLKGVPMTLLLNKQTRPGVEDNDNDEATFAHEQGGDEEEGEGEEDEGEDEEEDEEEGVQEESEKDDGDDAGAGAGAETQAECERETEIGRGRDHVSRISGRSDSGSSTRRHSIRGAFVEEEGEGEGEGPSEGPSFDDFNGPHFNFDHQNSPTSLFGTPARNHRGRTRTRESSPLPFLPGLSVRETPNTTTTTTTTIPPAAASAAAMKRARRNSQEQDMGPKPTKQAKLVDTRDVDAWQVDQRASRIWLHTIAAASPDLHLLHIDTHTPQPASAPPPRPLSVGDKYCIVFSRPPPPDQGTIAGSAGAASSASFPSHAVVFLRLSPVDDRLLVLWACIPRHANSQPVHDLWRQLLQRLPRIVDLSDYTAALQSVPFSQHQRDAASEPATHSTSRLQVDLHAPCLPQNMPLDSITTAVAGCYCIEQPRSSHLLDFAPRIWSHAICLASRQAAKSAAHEEDGAANGEDNGSSAPALDESLPPELMLEDVQQILGRRESCPSTSRKSHVLLHPLLAFKQSQEALTQARALAQRCRSNCIVIVNLLDFILPRLNREDGDVADKEELAERLNTLNTLIDQFQSKSNVTKMERTFLQTWQAEAAEVRGRIGNSEASAEVCDAGLVQILLGQMTKLFGHYALRELQYGEQQHEMEQALNRMSRLSTSNA
ncbi:hypothetical protein AC578_5850 [Pseudocercospora eumusae]|uniref:Uncharacterized protein n=1 Tax=Pseudocercospora eumusae TaxID=321146 RepID=A0A139GXR1_9PEZI|nr:hypothetical protein AC578_5850 [Pseudocercospora eumusae]